MYNKDSQLKFKTSMLKSSLCYYSDAYILAKGTISIVRKEGDNPNNANKEVVFENCAPFIDCINEINNTEIDNVKDIDVVVPMYNLIEHSNNYSKSRVFFFFFLIGIHSMHSRTVTTRHGVTRKEAQKRLQDTKNLFRHNLQLKHIC